MSTQNHPKKLIDKLLLQEKRYCAPDFSAEKMAKMLGVSACKLSRILKSEYGMSYTNIVHTHRIQDAMHHLQDKRLAPCSIDDIGFMVGFRNRQSFFNAFRKVTGTTPEQYRQTCQQLQKS